MSFKREGDDKSQLNILKKRRVADLLSNFIPEDEGALMSNGRYTCLVCFYRPVFDTVDMLTLHRNGKRHLEGLKAFYGKKARLKNEIGKRQHEIYVQAEETDKRQEPSCSAPLLEQTRKLTHHALLKTVPYNSCHRKTSMSAFTNWCRPPDTGAGAQKTPQKSPRNVSVVDSTAKKKPGLTAEGQEKEEEKPSVKPEVSNNPSQSGSSSSTAAAKGLSHPPVECPAAVTKEAEPITAERRTELEHYLKMKSNGWLRDRSGQWVKDENAEFDSDEEEPPSPPATH